MFTMTDLTLDEIREKVARGEYRFSDHAVKRMIKRSVERPEVEEVLFKGEVIEEYPQDKFSPSCLIFGTTGEGRPLHVQVSLPPVIVVVTVYEPDPEEWIGGRTRR